MSPNRSMSTIALLTGAILLAGCQDRKPPEPLLGAASNGTLPGNQLMAQLEPVGDTTLGGTAEFTATSAGVQVLVLVQGAPPGPKGLHVHERGDCSDPLGASMGSHFAPAGQPHGLPTEPGAHHLGDLGNIDIDTTGDGRLSVTVDGASLAAGTTASFHNRALILHSAADAGSAHQPAGDSGDPIACGVIG